MHLFFFIRFIFYFLVISTPVFKKKARETSEFRTTYDFCVRKHNVKSLRHNAFTLLCCFNFLSGVPIAFITIEINYVNLSCVSRQYFQTKFSGFISQLINSQVADQTSIRKDLGQQQRKGSTCDVFDNPPLSAEPIFLLWFEQRSYRRIDIWARTPSNLAQKSYYKS